MTSEIIVQVYSILILPLFEQEDAASWQSTTLQYLIDDRWSGRELDKYVCLVRIDCIRWVWASSWRWGTEIHFGFWGPLFSEIKKKLSELFFFFWSTYREYSLWDNCYFIVVVNSISILETHPTPECLNPPQPPPLHPLAPRPPPIKVLLHSKHTNYETWEHVW